MAGLICNLHSAVVDGENEEPGKIVESEEEERTEKLLIVTDKFRTVQKIVTATNLIEFLRKGKNFLGLSQDEEVYAVLDDDGTEVDDEEYFLLLPDDAVLMVLSSDQIWSPTINIKGSCIFDSTTNTFTSGQLATALMEHIKRATLGMHEKNTSPCKKKEGGDLHVTFVTQNTNNTAF